MDERFIESGLKREDVTFEVPLRPQTLGDFVGQESVCERLDILITAAQKRSDPLRHCLFGGPPGLGKTTLAGILARAMGTNLVVTSGPVIDKPGDLAGLLTNLQQGDVLFIDEIHRLPKAVEEYLYPAMEDFVLDLLIDSGPASRSVRVKLNKFTLVGATTRVGMLSSPMRSRFGIVCRLDHYQPKDLATIVLRSAKILGMPIDRAGASEIAVRARGTPRVSNNLLRWVRDYAQTRSTSSIDKELVADALAMLRIDEKGLDDLDRRILQIVIDHYDGGPVGLGTIAVAIGEEASTIEEVYEPFLIGQGLIKRTSRGREATRLAYEHLGKL